MEISTKSFNYLVVYYMRVSNTTKWGFTAVMLSTLPMAASNIVHQILGSWLLPVGAGSYMNTRASVLVTWCYGTRQVESTGPTVIGCLATTGSAESIMAYKLSV